MIQRILNRLRKPKPLVTSLEKYKEYIRKDETTVLLPNSSIRFDLEHKLEKRKYVRIGNKGLIKANFVFESEKGEVVIGNNVHLGGVTFISRNRIEIKNDVTMAWGIVIYDHNSHSLNWEERKNDNHQCYSDHMNHGGNNVVNKNWSVVKDKPIVIESKVWVGFDVTILKGVTIGEGAVIGAKSVVRGDVEAWTVVAGNPAVVVKYLPEYQAKK